MKIISIDKYVYKISDKEFFALEEIVNRISDIKNKKWSMSGETFNLLLRTNNHFYTAALIDLKNKYTPKMIITKSYKL